MLLHKGCEKRLIAHMAKLDTMIEDLRLIGRKGDERINGASDAWNKSANGKKFVKDLDTVEWLANQYLDMRRRVEKELSDADAAQAGEPDTKAQPNTRATSKAVMPRKAADEDSHW